MLFYRQGVYAETDAYPLHAINFLHVIPIVVAALPHPQSPLQVRQLPLPHLTQLPRNQRQKVVGELVACRSPRVIVDAFI